MGHSSPARAGLGLRPLERRTFLLGLSALALWIFFELADEIAEPETHAFDRAVLIAMRVPGNTADPIGPLWFEEAVRDLTALGGVAVLSLITLAVVCYLLLRRQRAMAFMVFITVAGGMVLSTALKGLFERPRPDVVQHLYEAFHSSFPSGHAMMAAVTYLTLGALLAESEKGRVARLYHISLAIAVTVVVGLSRIYIGVHWPTDVLGGWAAGTAWAALSWYWAHRLMLFRHLHEGSSSAHGRG